MNRSLLAVLVVGLLVAQGTVAGVLVDGPASTNSSNATTTTATVNGSPSAATATAMEDNESSVVTFSRANENDDATTSSPTETETSTTQTPTRTATGTETTVVETEIQTRSSTKSTSESTPTHETTAAETQPETRTRTTTETTDETTTSASTTEVSTTSRTTQTTTGTRTATPTAESANRASPTGDGDDTTDSKTGLSPANTVKSADSSKSATNPSAGSMPARASSSEIPSGASASRVGARGDVQSARSRIAGSADSAAAAAGRPSGAASGAAPSAAGGTSLRAAGGLPSGNASASGAQARSAGGQASAVSPDAEFEVSGVDADVAVGEPGTVSVTLKNTGEDATNAVVNFKSGSSELTFGQSGTTSRFIGDWDEGESKTIDLTMRAAPGADTAEYPVQATVSYDDDGGNPSRSAPITFGVTPAESSPDLSVESVSSDVPVGGSGNVSVTLKNTGEDATDAVVSLGSLSPDLLFGRAPNTTRFVGDWDAGETKTIEVTMRAARTADTDEYPVRASVSYQDTDGNDARLGPATFGVTPEGQQEFSLSGVSSDLEVGDSGTISGTVTNEGPKNATDAVLTVSPNSTRAVIPRQRQYVLGDLRTGESASFDLPVIVNATTEPGERQVQFFVQYYDSDGTLLRSDALTTQIDIDEGTDDFAIVSTETDLEAGGQGTLSVTMANTGENVTDATVSFQSLSSSVLFGKSANATRYVEEWNSGDRRTFEFDVASPTGTDGQRYPLQASVRYTDSDNDSGRAGPFTFGVTLGAGGNDFTIVSSRSMVPIGDTGPISVTLKNTGENATEAVVNLQSLSGDILFGRTANATAFVGEWPAGAQRTITVTATASNESDTRSYPLQASVSYNNSNGDQARAGPFTLGITPTPQQEFSLSDVRSSLRVGDTGNLSVNVTNEGPGDADSVVVQLVTQSQTLSPQKTEVAVGSLGANSSKRVSFPIEIPESAESGQRQFSFVVEYDNENGDTRRSDRLDVQAQIAGDRNAFTVERANDTAIDAGSSGTVTINITNNLDSPVTNLDAKAFVDDPLSVSNSEAYVSRIGPGETEQITFDVSVSGEANPAEYPLSVDFQYDTPGEDSQLSRTYKIPIETSQSDGGGLLSSLSVAVGLIVLLVVLGIGLVWSRR